jgi:hypothetical protein
VNFHLCHCWSRKNIELIAYTFLRNGSFREARGRIILTLTFTWRHPKERITGEL